MDEHFELPIVHNGQSRLIPATLVIWGYSHRFHVLVDGVSVTFEPDEERMYRAILDPSITNPKQIDVSLLQAIADSLGNIGT